MKIFYGILLTFFATFSNAQEISLSTIIEKNVSTFNFYEDEFKGEGWENLLSEIRAHQNILIGEDHFLNEIPLFVSELSKNQHFDNYFCEIDAHSAEFIASKLKSAAPNELEQFVAEYAYTFSFYALASEFNLLKTFHTQGTKIHGTDQIALTASKLIFAAIKNQTTNQDLKTICETIEEEAAAQFELFVSGQGEPYFFSEPFMTHLETITTLDLNEFEKNVIQKIRLSQTIYSEQSHHLRIQLMQNQLMAQYNNLINTKNLFKYGAMHMAKGESFLDNYDIGNLIHGISESQFQSSLHIMIIGKEGMQGSPFKGMEPQQIAPTDENLIPYAPFFEQITNEEWNVFDLQKILKTINKNNIQVDDITLQRVIKGYDYLVVIPKVTAATFIYE